MDKLITSSAEKSSTRKDGKYKVSHRVIIDHLRSSSFLIADGILPSNEGRGYVLRRIMRRGMRHAHILGCKDPLLCKLVPDLIEEMGDAFPELIEAKELIYNSLETEENKLKETLIDGSRLAMSSGMPGTHDIAISLMPSENRIMKFEEFGGHQANIKVFNANEIYWEFDNSDATWDWRLSRMSGSLKTGFIRKSTGGRIFNSYQCSKAEQKF